MKHARTVATSGHTLQLRNLSPCFSVTSGLTAPICDTVALGINPEVTYDKNRLCEGQYN